MGVKGPQRAPAPQYFSDPGLDALYQMMLVLAEEVAVLRERVDAALAVQQEGEMATRERVDARDLGDAYDPVRKDFVQRLLEPLEDLAERESKA
jgi:hypothetical protein